MKEASLRGELVFFLFSWQTSVHILDQTPSGSVYMFNWKLLPFPSVKLVTMVDFSILSRIVGSSSEGN